MMDSYNAKIVCFGEGAMELYTCEKKLFLSSCQYTHDVVHWLSWLHVVCHAAKKASAPYHKYIDRKKETAVCLDYN